MPERISADEARQAQQARYRMVVKQHAVMQGNALIDAALECGRIAGVVMLVLGVYRLATPSIWLATLLLGLPQLASTLVLVCRLTWHRMATWRAVRAYKRRSQ